MVSYRSARKIKVNIVTSKLYPVKRNIGCGGCGNGRCRVCKNIKITDTFDSFTTKKSYKINHKFDCNDKCLIYLFSCRAHAVSNIRVRLLLVSDIGGTITKW